MRILAALLLSLLGLSAKATSTIDYSDLWWVPTESGWGANVIQQGDVVFITLFVYDAANNPKWYVAPSTQMSASGDTTASFSGPLYETKGPFFGAANFNPNQVTSTEVGSITFSASGINAATLTYNAAGVTVTKSVQRQSWREDDITGVYLGATIGTFAGCGGADGYFESPAQFIVSKGVGPVVTIREEGSNYVCTYTGNYSQAGRMGSITGNGTCSTSGGAQSFVATELQGGKQGLTMRYSVRFAGACGATGRMGGMRKGN